MPSLSLCRGCGRVDYAETGTVNSTKKLVTEYLQDDPRFWRTFWLWIACSRIFPQHIAERLIQRLIGQGAKASDTA